MPRSTDDAERWRALASEARNIALEMTDPEAKRALLFIAAPRREALVGRGGR